MRITRKPTNNVHCSLDEQKSLVKFEGELSFFTVLNVREQGFFYIHQASHPTITFDFSSVNKMDTAGIALLLDWWRDAIHHQKNIQWMHLPERAKALIRLSDLADVLGVATC